MTGSGNNGLPQLVEAAVDANYVFAFVGDISRPGDEVYKRENGMEDQPGSSFADDHVDGERAIARMDAARVS